MIFARKPASDSGSSSLRCHGDNTQRSYRVRRSARTWAIRANSDGFESAVDSQEIVGVRFCGPRFWGVGMPRSYAGDLRERVIETVEGGATRHASAVQFRVSVSSAIRWVQRWRASGEVAAKPRGGSASPLEDHAAVLLAVASEQPDLTLDEFCAVLKEREITTSRVSIWRFFRRHGVSFKKNSARQRAGTARRGRGARALARGSALV
jgi:transposase